VSRDHITLDEARQLAAITPKQAGHLLGLGKNATYAGIHRGEIPSYAIGGRIVVPVAPLLERLEKGGRP
jgi:excisionase family DNA binding protein